MWGTREQVHKAHEVRKSAQIVLHVVVRPIDGGAQSSAVFPASDAIFAGVHYSQTDDSCHAPAAPGLRVMPAHRARRTLAIHEVPPHFQYKYKYKYKYKSTTGSFLAVSHASCRVNHVDSITIAAMTTAYAKTHLI